jgi:hypothetical protein
MSGQSRFSQQIIQSTDTEQTELTCAIIESSNDIDMHYIKRFIKETLECDRSRKGNVIHASDCLVGQSI